MDADLTDGAAAATARVRAFPQRLGEPARSPAVAAAAAQRRCARLVPLWFDRPLVRRSPASDNAHEHAELLHVQHGDHQQRHLARFEHVSLNPIGPMLDLSASVIEKRHRVALVRLHPFMDGWA